MSAPTVVALGGHALLDPELPPSVANQFAVTARAVAPVAELVARGERLVLTHGNGPQVGFMALRSELARAQVHAVPLDSLVADTQGALGYMVCRDLREELGRIGASAEVVALVTEIEVDPGDAALRHPTKPIGRFHTAEEAKALARDLGWTVAEERGRGWRRIVPSPDPLRIVQIEAIRSLCGAGVTVVACGGGGIPVWRDGSGAWRGVEGVVDKDLSSALLATEIGARRLFLTTAADGVYRDYGTEEAVLLPDLSLDDLLQLQSEGQFPPGSMGPKMLAARRFLEAGGVETVVCRPEALVEAWEGRAGTRIRRERP